MMPRVHDRCNRRNLVLVPSKLSWPSSPVLTGLAAVTKAMSHGTNPKMKKTRKNHYVRAVFSKYGHPHEINLPMP
jgi:hypothetical protein